jgi:S-adenosylmethionine synthetase
VDLFGRGATPLANDTSIGVGFAPRSRLERAVLDLGKWLDDSASQQPWPERGEDVKIMAVRTASAVTLTVTCALVSAFVKDAADYLAKKALLARAIGARASALLGEPARMEINAADDPARGSFYLTVSGTSAEAGDDGQVGRGNRVSGLITPGRPMTLEAAAGKNPVSHVGKLYSVAAGLIAEDLVAALPGVGAAECTLVSRIGSPIDDPQAVGVRLRVEDGRPAAAHSPAVAEAARGRLAGLPALSARLIAGEIAVF